MVGLGAGAGKSRPFLRMARTLIGRLPSGRGRSRVASKEEEDGDQTVNVVEAKKSPTLGGLHQTCLSMSSCNLKIQTHLHEVRSYKNQ